MLVRQAVRKWSIELGFSLVDQTKMITAASELARNTLDYGGGGTVRLEALEDGIRKGLRLTFEDQGPGIPDIELALTDGYTTGKGHGHGAERLEAAGQRVRDRFAGRRGHARHHHEVEVITTAGRPVVLALDESSKAGEARRLAAAMAERLGFDETERGRVAIVVTEAATNLFKHARGGELILQGAGTRDRPSAWRSWRWTAGRGWRTSAAAWPTASRRPGPPGTGWGRSSGSPTSFDIYSSLETGTAVAGAALGEARPPAVAGLGTGVRRRATSRWPARRSAATPGRWTSAAAGAVVLVVDGLGHGPQAAEAAREAVAGFREHGLARPAERILRAAHDALRKTRGAAMAVASRSTATAARCRFAGVGNIAGVILSTRPMTARARAWSRITARSGTRFARFRSSSIPGRPGRCWSCTPTGWPLTGSSAVIPGWRRRHPGLVAGVLYRDFRRDRDDVDGPRRPDEEGDEPP